MDNENVEVSPNESDSPSTELPKEFRSRKFSLISYCSKEQILEVLERRPVRGAVFIHHDRDTKPDGTLKEPHFHILVATNNAATLKQIRNWFPRAPNTLGQYIREPEAALRYLQHLDDPDKAQYSEDEIITYKEGKEPFFRAIESSGETAVLAEDIINDMISGTPTRLMVRRYGKDFILNYDRYYKIRCIIDSEEGKQSFNSAIAWAKICDLHDCGILSEYEYLRLADEYGASKRGAKVW